ncbi:MAG: GC-type dockerin domain-anchored protein [Phycisphaerales bacterium]
MLRYDEPTIAVSAADSRKIAIGWIRRDGPQILLGAITLSGVDVNDTVQSGFTPVPQLPFVVSNPSPCENLNLPTFAQADPISATSRVTGEVWIGGQATDGRKGGFCISRLGGTAQSPQLIQTTTAYCNDLFFGTGCFNALIDKPWIAIGPESGAANAAQTMVLVWNQGNNPSLGKLYIRRSDPASPPGEVWPTPAQFEQEVVLSTNPTSMCDPPAGFAGALAMIHSGSTKGRVVVAFRPPDVNGFYNLPAVTDLRPVVGQHGPVFQFIASTTAGQLFEFRKNDVPGGFEVYGFPASADDPLTLGDAYVVFTASPDPTTASNRRLDLYIARGRAFLDPNLQIFRTLFDSDNVFRITDAMLGEVVSDPRGTAQIMPAVYVDSRCGFVHLQYFAIWQDGADVKLQVKYAKLAGLAQGTPLVVSHHALAPAFSRDAFGPNLTDRVLGDYQAITGSECWILGAFMSAHEGYQGIYVSQIKVFPQCSADVEIDCAINGGDMLAFATAYAAGTTAADINKDGVVDGLDLAAFLADYGSSPP